MCCLMGRNGVGDGVEQQMGGDRFVQKGATAALVRPGAGVRIVAAGHENDRRRVALVLEQRLQLEPGHAIQVNVEQHAIERALLGTGQQQFGRDEGLDAVAVGAQQARKSAIGGQVVFDQGDQGRGEAHGLSVATVSIPHCMLWRPACNWYLGTGCRLARVQHAQARRRQHQPGQRIDLHFFHHAAPVFLDGALGIAEPVGDLLVEQALHHQREHFPLARGQRGHPFGHALLVGMLAQRAVVARDGPVDGVEQVGRGDRLGQEVFGAGLDRLHAHGDVGAAAEEHDGQRAVHADQVLLQLQAGQAWHMHVEQDAARSRRRRGALEAGGRVVHGDLEAGPCQQARQRAAQRGVVIDDVNGNAGAGVFHGGILHPGSRLRKTGLGGHMLDRDLVASGLLGLVQLGVPTRTSVKGRQHPSRLASACCRVQSAVTGQEQTFTCLASSRLPTYCY
jgi:hypothetical protein